MQASRATTRKWDTRFWVTQIYPSIDIDWRVGPSAGLTNLTQFDWVMKWSRAQWLGNFVGPAEVGRALTVAWNPTAFQ